MSNTSHLDLIKPSANTPGWGSAINGNFDKIDGSCYNKIKVQIFFVA